ncbi:DNA-binding MarR family transcriptional regulator [Neomicrococcus aestuarii]|uniref:DNA-binding MarR family transcriptional regulator n=1 Tax=Neomicrococcus aestuarii TaxID=556325 RepID=A0A7W8X1M2_9MICC|nr:transcriptional regulator [Neomicrococcus aestuarii]MBB5512944.1 DNA-binding MarR family transcriptional regulator [Neomicrococcus aestuarii]
MEADFDEIIHVPTRLRICALLAGAGEVEFSVIRDGLTLSDSVLSKHLKVLEQAGYVNLRKGTVNTRTRTRVHMTKAGSRAFKGHIQELRRLAASADHLAT